MAMKKTKATSKKEMFKRSGNEAELLLKVTQEYKVQKAAE